MGSKIFLSYAREDHRAVTELHRDLTTMGNEVFYDQELTGGQSWWSTLLQRIRQCDLFVPVVGASWMESTPCRLEADYAQALGKSFLPVVLGDVSAKLLPAAIAETQWVGYDSSDKDSVLILARAVSTVPPSATLPEPTVLTARVNSSTKLAVTVLSASTVRVAGLAVPDRSPLHPVKA